MAIPHLSIRAGTRANGACAAGLAEYVLRKGRHAAQADQLVHTESGNMPAWAADDPRTYWQAADEFERANGCLFREVEFALPRELTREQQIALATTFCRQIADAHRLPWTMALHDGGTGNPHVHLMLSERQQDGIERDRAQWFMRANPKAPEKGGARKARGLGQNGRWSEIAVNGVTTARYHGQPGSWAAEIRGQWEELANDALGRAGHAERISMASYAAQGLGLRPGIHLGRAGHMAARGLAAERADEQAERRAQQRAAIEADPSVVLDKLTQTRATFNRRDIARELGRYVDDPAAFAGLMARIEANPALVLLHGQAGDAGAVYSTHGMVAAEATMADHADAMAARLSHVLPGGMAGFREGIGARATLSEEQQAALSHVLGGEQLAVLVGGAGTGKSTILGTAREAWEAGGYRVIGAALAGKAADGLQEGAGIHSSTIASLELRLKRGTERLGARDVLVVDEAGMVGSRQMARVLEAARTAGAKVVLVGDAEQLQPIEAGAAFRAIAERVGFVDLTTVRRQRTDWMRQASQAFACGRTGEALQAYDQHRAVVWTGDRDVARTEIAADYLTAGNETPDASRIILAHSNRDVTALNEAVRQARAERGELGADMTFAAERGARQFAPGDRLVFLENDRQLGVKNGTLGTVAGGADGSLVVTLDGADGRQVRFSAERYAAVDHGYAVTLHKAQGVTVDRAFVLATPGMDRHLAYVGMTRHRDDVRLYYGRDDFEEKSELYRTLGRKRQATTTLDFAERRGIETRRSWFEAARDALGNLGRRLESALEFARLKERVDRATDAALQAGRDADAPASATDRPGAELFARQRQREAERKRQIRPSLPRERPLAKRSTEAQRRLQEQRKLAEKVAARAGASVPTQKDDRSLTEKEAARRVEVGTAPASQPRPGRIVLQKRPMPAEERSLADEVAGKRQERRGPPALGDLAERCYLAVPFAEKDQAKALGARWDKDAGAWWIGAREDTAPFQQWLDPNRLQTEQDPKLRLQIGEARVKAATAQFGDFEGRHGREADAYEAAFRRCQEQMTRRAYTLARRIDQQRVKERDRFQEQWPKPTPPTGIKALKPGATARYEGQVANWEAAEKARNERAGSLYRRGKLVEKLGAAVYSGGALVAAGVAREHPELADRGATLKAERIKLDNAKRDATSALRNERDRQQERQRDRSRDQDLEM